MRFLDLLENGLFYAEDDKGGTSADDKDKDKEKKDSDGGEETITLTKAEYEEKLNQKYAEGARKATQGKLKEEEKPKEEPKPNDEILTIKQELEVLKAEKIAGKVGVSPTYQEDIIALVRGKGLELTEENIKKEAERHKEWLLSNDENKGGVQRLGSTGGEPTPSQPDEKTQARKAWGLD